MDTISDVLKMIAIAGFLIMLYSDLCKKPKIEVVRVPTVREIKRKKKRARRLRKVKRRFRIPYIGRTEVITYDKKRPYLDAVWDEIEGKK